MERSPIVRDNQMRFAAIQSHDVERSSSLTKRNTSSSIVRLTNSAHLWDACQSSDVYHGNLISASYATGTQDQTHRPADDRPAIWSDPFGTVPEGEYVTDHPRTAGSRSNRNAITFVSDNRVNELTVRNSHTNPVRDVLATRSGEDGHLNPRKK